MNEQRMEQRVRQRLLLAPTEGDRLMLDDATLRATLEGSRPLAAAELAALHASPLTLRRFRHLALARRNAAWQASGGMLRAADSGAALAQLVTDDGNWSLHFVAQAGGWQVILRLDPAAPFAAALLRESPLLRVADGAGVTVLEGRLDADGECEAAWPFDEAPAVHFQAHGAAFTVRREP